MATFHLFPQLPAELRLQIWNMTVEPRIVNVRFKVSKTYDQPWSYTLTSSTPVPAALQTCQEARNAGLYQPTFSDIAIISGAAEDYERRYVWLNLDIDMVSFSDHNFARFRPYAHLIKRLRFTRDNCDEFWCRMGGSDELRYYKNVSEIHVVLCEGGDFEDWHGSSQSCVWHCGNENVLFIDKQEGVEMKLMDLEYKYDREWEARHREQGENVTYLNGSVTNWPEYGGTY